MDEFKGGAVNIDMRSRTVERAKMEGYIPTGLDYLDDRMLGLMKTDFLLIGAETGAGKTTLAQMMAKLAAQKETRPTFFALEAYKGEVEDRYLFREMARLAWAAKDIKAKRFTFRRWLAGECKHIDAKFREEAITNIEPWVSQIRVFYRDKKFTHRDITRELMAEAASSDFFVFDHIHYVDTDDQNENRGLSEVVKALRNITLVTERPVVAVAHLRKRPGYEKGTRLVPTKDDFHGSSDLIKIATQVVILAPGLIDTEKGSSATTYIRLDKERYDGTSDRYVAAMQFDRNLSTYKDGYELMVLTNGGTEIEPVYRDDLPNWAVQATKVNKPVSTEPDAPRQDMKINPLEFSDAGDQLVNALRRDGAPF